MLCFSPRFRFLVEEQQPSAVAAAAPRKPRVFFFPLQYMLHVHGECLLDDPNASEEPLASDADMAGPDLVEQEPALESALPAEDHSIQDSPEVALVEAVDDALPLVDAPSLDAPNIASADSKLDSQGEQLGEVDQPSVDSVLPPEDSISEEDALRAGQGLTYNDTEEITSDEDEAPEEFANPSVERDSAC